MLWTAASIAALDRKGSGWLRRVQSRAVMLTAVPDPAAATSAWLPPPPPRQTASSASMSRSQVVEGNDVKGIDADGKLIVANNHDNFGRDENEIPVRHGVPAPVREAKDERHKSIFKPLLDLVNHVVRLLPTMPAGKGPGGLCHPNGRSRPCAAGQVHRARPHDDERDLAHGHQLEPERHLSNGANPFTVQFYWPIPLRFPALDPRWKPSSPISIFLFRVGARRCVSLRAGA